eukprot:gene1070-15403_t
MQFKVQRNPPRLFFITERKQKLTSKHECSNEVWFTGSQLPRSLIQSKTKSRTRKENDVDGCEANIESEQDAVAPSRKKRKMNTRRSARPIETDDDVKQRESREEKNSEENVKVNIGTKIEELSISPSP